MRACSSGDRYPGPPWPSSAASTARPVWATSPSTARSTGRCAPIADTSSSTCTTVVSGPISRPWRIVHMLSEHPQPTIRSAAPISSAASGVAKPPLTSRSQGFPRNRPLAAAEVASSAPHASASRSRSARAFATRAPRPATNTGRCALARTRASSAAASVPGGQGPSGGARRDRRRVTLRRLHVQRHREHHRAALRLRGPVGPGHVGDGRAGGVQPVGLRPDRGGERRHVDPEVGPHRRAGHVRRQHQQRRPALGRLGDAGERVGQARPLMDRHQADPAGRPRPAVGHAGGAAFVAGGDEPGAPGDQGVGHVEVAAAHHAEHRVGAEAGEHRPGRLAHQHRGNPLRPVRPGRAPGTGCPSLR